MGVELFHADGQTDKMKLVDAFRHFTNGTKIVILKCLSLVSNV